MPYLGRAPTGTGSVTEIDGDLKITGQLTAQDTLFKQILDGTDGSSTNAGDNIIIEDGGTDGSGTNAGDDICLEKATEGVSDISSIASTILSPANTGSIKEVVSLLCDGSSVTVGSGTYTSTDVTAALTTTTTYADLTGSSINYTPPAGTTSVLYEFRYVTGYVDAAGGTHHKLFLDGTEVANARFSDGHQGGLGEAQVYCRWLFKIGDGDNTNTGKVSDWSSAKIIKFQVRSYNSGYQVKCHQTTYFDGGGGSHLSKPTISVTAYS